MSTENKSTVKIEITSVVNGFIVRCDGDAARTHIAKTTYDLGDLVRKLFERPAKPKPLVQAEPDPVQQAAFCTDPLPPEQVF